MSTFRYKGIEICQHPDIDEYFSEIMDDFTRIIELGTYYGGLTQYLNDFKRYDCDLISYDLQPWLCQLPEGHGIDVRKGNFYLKKTQREIKELIQDTDKRVLVLCDGGDKVFELSTFCKFLKPGDVIMCHDYAENDEEWHKFTDPIDWEGVYTQPWGSTYEEIKGLIGVYVEKHRMYNQFKKVLWGAFVKI